MKTFLKKTIALACFATPLSPASGQSTHILFPSVRGILFWEYPRGLLCCKGYLPAQKPVFSILLHMPPGCQSPWIKRPLGTGRRTGLGHPIDHWQPIRPQSQTTLKLLSLNPMFLRKSGKDHGQGAVASHVACCPEAVLEGENS